jgi:hypothetical protein
MLTLRVYGLQASAFLCHAYAGLRSCQLLYVFSTLKLRLRRKSAKISQVFTDEHFLRLEW